MTAYREAEVIALLADKALTYGQIHDQLGEQPFFVLDTTLEQLREEGVIGVFLGRFWLCP